MPDISPGQYPHTIEGDKTLISEIEILRYLCRMLTFVFKSLYPRIASDRRREFSGDIGNARQLAKPLFEQFELPCRRILETALSLHRHECIGPKAIIGVQHEPDLVADNQ